MTQLCPTLGIRTNASIRVTIEDPPSILESSADRRAKEALKPGDRRPTGNPHFDGLGSSLGHSSRQDRDVRGGGGGTDSA